MKVLLPISTMLKFAFWVAVIAIVIGVVLGAGNGATAPTGSPSAPNARLSLVAKDFGGVLADRPADPAAAAGTDQVSGQPR